MSERPRVALFVESSSEFGRMVLSGIRSYIKANTSWSIYLQQRDLNTRLPNWLSHWQGGGIISRSTTPEYASIAKKMRIPLVDLTDRYGDLELPQIWPDHERIGSMAAEHLLEREFHHFAFAGYEDEVWSSMRQASFTKRIQEAGYQVHQFVSHWDLQPGTSWDDEYSSLVRWLEQLPKPVGIMAANDVRGQQILDVCCEINLAVPEQSAVIGCDNDGLRCELCDPPLTSVIPNAEQIGYQSARLLDELMTAQRRGISLQRERIVIPPTGIYLRKSTDILAIDDPEIAEAVRVIRQRALSGLKVEDVLKTVAISRSTLERGVRKYLKRSPQAEIRRVQLAHACELLANTDMTLPEIASRCGFVHPEYFSVVFKRQLNLTPGQYRQDHSQESGSVWTGPPVIPD